MSNYNDYVGKVFSRLTVLSATKYNNHKAVCLCQCECGNTKKVRADHLQSGKTRSCGCMRKEVLRTHGLSLDPLYSVWTDMKQRCTNPNNIYFPYYGGRGIKVDPVWYLSFPVFRKATMEAGWMPGLQIDRIDNDGNYEPGNLRCVTSKVNQRNRRNTVMYKDKSVAEWCEDLGLNLSTVYKRINRSGWTMEAALFTPVQTKNIHV